MRRPPNPERLYVISLLWTRTVVGALGLLLPAILIVGEAFFLKGSVHVRGSISAYYHTSMQDEFVGILVVVGVLLVGYMIGEWNVEFWISCLAGLFLLGLVYFPTDRPSPVVGTCGQPHAESCSSTENWLGETRCAHLHYVCATGFLISLCILAFVFARRERRSGASTWLVGLHTACGVAIAAALGLIVVGDLLHVHWTLTPLYLGEVTTITAFAVGWLAKAYATGRSLPQPSERNPCGPDDA